MHALEVIVLKLLHEDIALSLLLNFFDGIYSFNIMSWGRCSSEFSGL